MFRLRGVCHVQFSVVLRASVENQYKKLNQREHILKRPDMYVGTVHPVQGDWWLYNTETNKMEYSEVEYVPALQKIFDEIIVNAADNKVRQKDNQTYVSVTVDPKTGWISVKNDGAGIPVKMHKEYKMWVPELIFGNLLTSSNYNDTERRVTGGCYGYGAKLTNIFSTQFKVETYDSIQNRMFVMEWSKNMQHRGEPTVTNDFSSLPLEKRRLMGYTKISFLPDYEMLNVPDGKLTNDMQRILHRRVLDLCGIMGHDMKVYYNKSPIALESFQQYAQLFPIDNGFVIHQKGKRWDMTIGMSQDEKFHGVSFVNSTFVTNNGTHMKYVLDEIISAVRDAIAAKDPSLRVRPEAIKSHLFLFINCQIENPQFDSQQKQELRSQLSTFGSYPNTKAFVAKIVQETNLVNIVINELNRKFISKAQPTASRRQMICIPKLEDARLAGTAQSDECTLIITEGDSAKAVAVVGLNVVGRDRYGVFPVRGKPLNIRGLSKKQIAGCTEVMNILRILGISLDSAMPQKTRYGKVMIMADQDIDGVHIKGLLCNIIEVVAPHLYQRTGFLSQFITPLVKVTGSKNFSKSFYSVNECKKYLSSIPPAAAKQLRTKYYKGLGTSTSTEALEYFKNIKANTIEFKYDPKTDENALEMPFGKHSAAERKMWIAERPSTALDEEFDFSVRELSFQDFINKQFIQYSLSDCARTLPNFIDGFKTTQRKILYGALRRDLHVSIKVQELAGYVSEHCGYCHGDSSLTGAIIRMAQDFVGSNNIPLLYPEGQFGTRMENGNDSAAARYIFTKLGRLTKYIFREEDAHNLMYAHSEGKQVEPLFYVPVVPMVLVNGSKGIATGFSTIIPPHNIRDLIARIKAKLAGKGSTMALMPFHEGFQGEIMCSGRESYQTVGTWELMSPYCIRIKEIPTCYSIHDMKARLDTLYELGVVSLYEEHHTTRTVDFDVYCHPQVISALVRANMVHRFFKIVSPMTFLHLSCLDGSKIRVFNTVNDIFEQFCTVRMKFYTLRKESELKRLENSRLILQNKQLFLKSLLGGTLVLPDDPQNAPDLLAKSKFDLHPLDKSYAYLLDQRISVLSRSNLANIEKKIRVTTDAIATIKKLSEKDLWLKDLAALETEIERSAPKKTASQQRKSKEISGISLSAAALDYVRKAILVNQTK